MRALALEIDPLPFVVDIQAAFRDQRIDGDPFEDSRGDVDAALAAAEVSVELQVETPGQLQTPIEPHAAVAWWKPDELICWIATQGIFDARDELTRRFNVPKERVRVIAEYIGGGFGGKQNAGFEALMAVELSKRTGRPVRLVLDRHGEQLDGGARPATHQTVRLGAGRDGVLTAIDAEALVEYGMAGWRAVTTPALTLYRCADVRGIEANLRLDVRRGNAFRAPAVMEGITALEQAMDELAIELDDRPARPAPAQLHRPRPVGRPALHVERAAVLLRPRRRAGGLVGPRAGCTCRPTTGCCAAWAARRRSGGAAAGHPRTPPAASAATASRLSRSACRTSAPAR